LDGTLILPGEWTANLSSPISISVLEKM
jgi:hypothetical protein